MTTPTPLPCPFCGEDYELDWQPAPVHGSADTYGGCVHCWICDASGPWRGDWDHAVVAWNYAPRESPPDHLAERLRNARRRGRRVLARRRSRWGGR